MKISNFKLKIIYTSLLIIVALLVLPKTITAHTLKVDGSIGVTVHIDPDDAPKAGEKSTIFVTIKDRSGQFDEKNPGGCGCVLSIQKDGKTLTTFPIVTDNVYNSLKYTFPNAGTYILKVSGKPNGKGNAFQPFSTTVEYYVKSSNATIVDKSNPLLLYFPYLLLFTGIIILFMFLNPFAKKQ